MEVFVLIIHVVVALGIIGLVLIQHGKGADVGAAFGSGASGTVFGATGSANFLSRATAIMAVVFFLTSLGLTYFSSRKTETRGVMSEQPVPGQTVPGPSLPGQIPPPQGAAPAEQKAAPTPAPAAQPSPGATGEGGKVQEVPK